jgi:integrase
MDYFPAGILIGSVTTTHFAEWRDKRSKEVAPGTVRREISLLSSVLETARKEWRLIDANPLSDIKKPRQPEHRDVVLGRWQIRSLLKALDWQSGPCKSTKQSVGRALLLALRTGMRAGELCGLSWANVKEDYCILPVTKTKPRNVPLAPKARSIVERMRGWNRHLVFGVKSQTLDATFRKAKSSAGIDGVTFHDSRHTAATWLAQKIEVLDLCKMFGWSDPRMAMVYYNPTASDIAKRLSAPSPGQRSRSVSGRRR